MIKFDNQHNGKVTKRKEKSKIGKEYEEHNGKKSFPIRIKGKKKSIALRQTHAGLGKVFSNKSD